MRSHCIMQKKKSWEVGKHIIYIDSSREMRHLPDRSYIIQANLATHMHPDYDTINGKYGTYGIVRFFVPGHGRIGVHSGRKYVARNPGPIHPTWGCIRTTEEAMQAIHDLISTDSLNTITVINNLPKKPVNKKVSSK